MCFGCVLSLFLSGARGQFFSGFECRYPQTLNPQTTKPLNS